MPARSHLHFEGTTILSVRRAGHEGRMRGDQILAGFAGGTADAFTLFERFEAKLDKHQATSSARGSNWPRTGAPIGP